MRELHPDFDRFFVQRLKPYYEAATALRFNATKQLLRTAALPAAGIGLLYVSSWFRGPVMLGVLTLGAVLIFFLRDYLTPQKYAVRPTDVQQQALTQLASFVAPEMRYTLAAPDMKQTLEHMLGENFEYCKFWNCLAGRSGGRLIAALQASAGHYREETVERDGQSVTRKIQVSRFKGFLIALETDSPIPAERVAALKVEFAATPLDIYQQDGATFVAMAAEHTYFAPGTDDSSWLNSAQSDAATVCTILDLADSLTSGTAAEQVA